MKWHKSYIGDVCLVGDGAHAKIQRQAEGILYLTCKNFKQGQLDLSKVDYISEEDYEKYFKKESKALTKPQVNDILFSIIGTLGERYIYKEQDYFGISSSVSILRPFLNKVYPLFLFYWIKSNTFQKALYGIKGGVAQGYVSLDMIRALPIHYPDDIAIQHKIADILSKYDDLIENNRRRIELLEESARLLYREWFVYLRFPRHEHTLIIDGIPEGWEKKKIGDICETVGGGTPSTNNPEYWNDGDITWLVPTDVTRNKCLALLDSERKITEAGLKNSSAKLVPPDTILMTSRASVGFFALMDKEVCTNQGFICVIPYEENRRMYILYNLMYRVEEIRSHAGGSTYTEISKSRFRNLDILIPSYTLLQQFQEQTYQILQQVRLLNKQIVKLQQARDILLPRLMNGEIAV